MIQQTKPRPTQYQTSPMSCSPKPESIPNQIFTSSGSNDQVDQDKNRESGIQKRQDSQYVTSSYVGPQEATNSEQAQQRHLNSHFYQGNDLNQNLVGNQHSQSHLADQYADHSRKRLVANMHEQQLQIDQQNEQRVQQKHQSQLRYSLQTEGSVQQEVRMTDEGEVLTQTKRAKEFMNNLQDRLNSLKGNFAATEASYRTDQHTTQTQAIQSQQTPNYKQQITETELSPSKKYIGKPILNVQSQNLNIIGQSQQSQIQQQIRSKMQPKSPKNQSQQQQFQFSRPQPGRTNHLTEGMFVSNEASYNNQSLSKYQKEFKEIAQDNQSIITPQGAQRLVTNSSGREQQIGSVRNTQSTCNTKQSDDKGSNNSGSSANAANKRKQSQPKQGEKGQTNGTSLGGIQQHSSSDSSGGSQVENKELEKNHINQPGSTSTAINNASSGFSSGIAADQVLPYPNAQADALAFLQAQQEQSSRSQSREDSSNQVNNKPVDSIQESNRNQAQKQIHILDVSNVKDETDKQQINRIVADSVKQQTQLIQSETQAQVAEQSNSAVENEFQSFFQEMNDKANDIMGMQQPEPDKALELLKQVEEFLKKIQSANKHYQANGENQRMRHIRTELDEEMEDELQQKRNGISPRSKPFMIDQAAKNATNRLSIEKPLSSRAYNSKNEGQKPKKSYCDDQIQLQGSGADFKNLMGMSPANMVPEEDLYTNKQVFHTIYRTNPLQSESVGNVVKIDQNMQNTGAQRSKTSMSANGQNKQGELNQQIEGDHCQQQQNKLAIDPMNPSPYKIEYTIKQLTMIQVDPTFKVILFYNMACCYQRLHLNDECTQYLETATRALQERIKLLEAQESTLLHQNYTSNGLNHNNPQILYVASSRTSVKQTDEKFPRDENPPIVTQLLKSAELHNMSLKNKLCEMDFIENKMTTIPEQTLADQVNIQNYNLNKDRVNLSISQTQLSTSMAPGELVNLQNFKYEKLLAQKMQSLRYQCKLHLQICAVLSQQGMHRDALIYGNKSSQLCYQLIKDAQLLCKRQMQQIRRQQKALLDQQSDSDQDQDPQGTISGDDDESEEGAYGEMGVVDLKTRPNNKTQSGKDIRRVNRTDKTHEQQSMYSVATTKKYVGRNPTRSRSKGSNRIRSSSAQNKQSNHRNQADQGRIAIDTQNNNSNQQTQVQKSRNSPRMRRADIGKDHDSKSRQSHSTDSKQRNCINQATNILKFHDSDPRSLGQATLTVAESQHQHTSLMTNPIADVRQQNHDTKIRTELNQKRAKSRNYHGSVRSRQCTSENSRADLQSQQSNSSLYSSSSLAKIKIRRAFDNNSKSSGSYAGQTSNNSSNPKKGRSKIHARDNSVSSQLSQESLKKIYSFALKNSKSIQQMQLATESDAGKVKDANKNQKEKQPEKDSKQKQKPAKVYYVEEQVKILSEIIQMADPILTELSSQIFQFEKLAQRKITYKQRDIELYRRYGREDFMAERDKLNISFKNLKEIKSIQQIKKFKIAVRNTLGLKQLDDWIYNLNIGNVMHLSLMSADELQPIENCVGHSSSLATAGRMTQISHSHQNSLAGQLNDIQAIQRLQTSIDIDSISRDCVPVGTNVFGFNNQAKSNKEDVKQHEKNLFETSHDLCKDAMLEKIVLISVAYFCIATEMRFIIQKQKQQKSLQKKDSEMYHAKALHISSLFLPKECPLVQHITQSYNKNYLKDKPPVFDLDQYITQELGISLDHSQSEENITCAIGTETGPNTNQRYAVINTQNLKVETSRMSETPLQHQKTIHSQSNQFTQSEAQKSRRKLEAQYSQNQEQITQFKRNYKPENTNTAQTKTKQEEQIKKTTQAIVPQQLLTQQKQQSQISQNMNIMNDTIKISSHNKQDRVETSSVNAASNQRLSKETLKAKEAVGNKKQSINSLKKSPASMHKLNLHSFNSLNKPAANHLSMQSLHPAGIASSFAKRGSMQTQTNAKLTADRMNISQNRMSATRALQRNSNQQSDGHQITSAVQKQKRQQMITRTAHTNSSLMRTHQQVHVPVLMNSPNHNQSNIPQNQINQTQQKLILQGQTSQNKSATNMQQQQQNISARMIANQKSNQALSSANKPSRPTLGSSNNLGSQTRSQPFMVQSAKHGIQRHYINLTEATEKNSHSATKLKINQQTKRGSITQSKKTHQSQTNQQRLNTDGPIERDSLEGFTTNKATNYNNQSQFQITTQQQTIQYLRQQNQNNNNH